MASYLDKDGLSYFWGKVKAKIPSAYDVTPAMDGTASAGSSSAYARGDHVHPTDTSRVPTSRTINGKALTSNIQLTPADIGTIAIHQISINLTSETCSASWQDVSYWIYGGEWVQATVWYGDDTYYTSNVYWKDDHLNPNMPVVFTVRQDMYDLNTGDITARSICIRLNDDDTVEYDITDVTDADNTSY